MAGEVTKLDREIDCYRDAIDELHGQLTGETLIDWIADQRDPTVGDGVVAWRTIRDRLRDRTNIKLPDVTLIRWFEEVTADDKAAA